LRASWLKLSVEILGQLWKIQQSGDNLARFGLDHGSEKAANGCIGAVAAEACRAPDAPRLGADQAAHECAAGRGHMHAALAAVGIAGRLDDKTALDELAEYAREALLGDVENEEEICDAQARIAGDEVEYTMMRAAIP